MVHIKHGQKEKYLCAQSNPNPYFGPMYPNEFILDGTQIIQNRLSVLSKNLRSALERKKKNLMLIRNFLLMPMKLGVINGAIKIHALF
ncbi:MAG: hypothetical protein Ct9H300mP29_1500 [Candidatus Neomarinimicrobiota bacterium]|nr:MAG: hypothetical protein Ct9H300mP29_1500 [Candidatus Neomarinimicrobiota bacterium]